MRFPERMGGGMKLTVKTTDGIKLPTGKSDCIVFDDDIAGFGLRLREGGSRTWVYQYRIGKKQRRMVLGSAKSVPLSLARKNAGDLEAKVRLGGDPAMNKENARLEVDNTFAVLADQFLEARKPSWRTRTYEEVKRYLIKDVKSLHPFPITAIAQRNIANLLSDIAKEKGNVTANRVRSSLCAFFGWIIREGVRLPEGNVASYTNKRDESSRDRVLTDGELALIWNACLDDDYGAILKLLMLTGQRANEIAQLHWNEVHNKQIVLPAERTKNARSHVIPLSGAAQGILPWSRKGDRKFVFGRDDTGFSGWGKAKEKLDARVAETKKPLEHWTVHDLRRTVATRLAELGVHPHIIEAVLNHVSGHKGGVAGIYNRATYDKDKREALNLWAEHVMATVQGRAPTVVPLKRA
jgi:integrase